MFLPNIFFFDILEEAMSKEQKKERSTLANSMEEQAEQVDHYQMFDSRTKVMMVFQGTNQNEPVNEEQLQNSLSNMLDTWTTYPLYQKNKFTGTLRRGVLLEDPPDYIQVIPATDLLDFTFSVNGLWNPYKEEFFSKSPKQQFSLQFNAFHLENAHFNFITKTLSPSEDRDAAILSVMSIAENGHYTALLWSRWVNFLKKKTENNSADTTTIRRDSEFS